MTISSLGSTARDHPFVPTCQAPVRRAQTLSRMAPAPPAQPARSVLDSGEHGATLIATDKTRGVTAPQITLD
jgi:hypothetical protein